MRGSPGRRVNYPGPLRRRVAVGTEAIGAGALFGREHVRPDRAGRVLSRIPAMVRRRHDPGALRRLGRGPGRLQLPARPVRIPHAQPEAPARVAAGATGGGPVPALPGRLAAHPAGPRRLQDQFRPVVRGGRRRPGQDRRSRGRPGVALDDGRLRQAGRRYAEREPAGCAGRCRAGCPGCAGLAPAAAAPAPAPAAAADSPIPPVTPTSDPMP